MKTPFIDRAIKAAKTRYIIRREMIPRYAVGGTQAARWCVCDTWDDERPIGFGIRKYEVLGIAKWLNTQNRLSSLPKHGTAEPYWEWRQAGDNFFWAGKEPQCVRAHHQTSLVGSYWVSFKKAINEKTPYGSRGEGR